MATHSSEDYFDAHVGFWNQLYDRRDVFARIHQRRQSAALSWLQDALADRSSCCLEVGCGAGHLTVQLGHFCHVLAADSSEQMLVMARRRTEQHAAHFLAADIRSLPLPDASVDAVVALGVLPWVPDWRAALAELARVVRVGGTVVVNADNR